MSRATSCGFRAAAGLVLAMAGSAPLQGAGEVTVSIGRGRVTLVATDARLGEVLAEWSRVGGTRFVGADPLGREAITLHLVDAPEALAIGLLLRAAAGYVAAPRRAGRAGSSRYGRVTILATSEASWRDRPTDPEQDGRAASISASGAAAPPELVALEELQRLLDAAAGNGAGAGRGARADPNVPVMTTPFPAIGALRELSPAPGR